MGQFAVCLDALFKKSIHEVSGALSSVRTKLGARVRAHTPRIRNILCRFLLPPASDGFVAHEVGENVAKDTSHCLFLLDEGLLSTTEIIGKFRGWAQFDFRSNEFPSGAQIPAFPS